MIETDIDANVRINVSINGRSFLVSEGGLRLLRRGIIPESLRFLGTSVREIEDRKFLVEDIDKNDKNDENDKQDDKNDKQDDKNDKNDPNVRIMVIINDDKYLVSEVGLRLLKRGIAPRAFRSFGSYAEEIGDRKFLVKSDGRFKMVDITLNGKRMVVSEDEYETLLSGIVPPHYERQGGSPVVETSTDNFVVIDKQDDKNDENDKQDDKIDKKEIVMTTAPKGYEDLYGVLLEALEQTAQGKGKERHGNGKPFSEQPIMTIAAEHGVGFLTGQAAKKLGESHTLLNIKGRDAAVAELLGAIAYTAAAILHLRRTK